MNSVMVNIAFVTVLFISMISYSAEINIVTSVFNNNDVKSSISISDKLAALDENHFVNQSFKIFNKDQKFYPAAMNPKLQILIDEIIKEIFTSSTEKNSVNDELCELFDMNPQHLSVNLGISEKTSQDIFNHCKNNFNTTQKHDHKESFKKEFIFVTNLDSKFIYDSWTNFNKTYIFINNQSISKIDLILRILHELVLPRDFKVSLSEKNLDEFLSSDKCIISSQTSQSELKIKSKIEEIYKLPYLKYVLSVTRAFKYESQFLVQKYGIEIFENLKDGYLYRDLLTNTKNKETLIKINEIMYPRYFDFVNLEYLFIPYESRAEIYSSLYVTQDLNTIIKYIHQLFDSSLNIQCQTYKDLKTYSLAEYLLLPSFGIKNYFYGRGPRPNSGGGWGPGIDQQ